LWKKRRRRRKRKKTLMQELEVQRLYDECEEEVDKLKSLVADLFHLFQISQRCNPPHRQVTLLLLRPYFR
jgi:DNA-directed RNA polymerase specialized sigma24 family protein